MTVQLAPRRRRRGIDIVADAMSEGMLHRAVVQQIVIRAHPTVFWAHIPNGEKRSQITGALLKAMGVQRGVPDLLFIQDGKVYFLELKTAKGRLSLEQRAVHAALREAGAIVETAYGLDAAIAQLVAWEIIRPG
jgi:hypothetical protein